MKEREVKSRSIASASAKLAGHLLFATMALGSGALAAWLLPPKLHLVAFLVAVASGAVLAIGSNKFGNAGLSLRASLLVAFVVMGPTGTEARSGPVPKLLDLTLLFLLGFVLVLGYS